PHYSETTPAYLRIVLLKTEVALDGPEPATLGHSEDACAAVVSAMALCRGISAGDPRRWPRHMRNRQGPFPGRPPPCRIGRGSRASRPGVSEGSVVQFARTLRTQAHQGSGSPSNTDTMLRRPGLVSSGSPPLRIASFTPERRIPKLFLRAPPSLDQSPIGGVRAGLLA